MGLIVLQGVFISAQAPSTYSLTALKFPTRATVSVPMVDAIGSLGSISGPTLLGMGCRVAGWLGYSPLERPVYRPLSGRDQPRLGSPRSMEQQIQGARSAVMSTAGRLIEDFETVPTREFHGD